MAPWRPGLEAVISFTGHAVFAVAPDIPDHLLDSLGADGFGGAHDPRLVTALAIISEGIAGLTELSFELEPGRRGQGGGATLVRDALSVLPAGELAVAAVAPGNAASLRALLAARFAPLGSLQLFRR